MEAEYDSVTINGVRLPSASISYVSTLPPEKTLGTYSASATYGVSATITLQRDGWERFRRSLPSPVRRRWDDKPAWMRPLFKAHEGGGNARQRRKRLRAALCEAVRLRAVEHMP